MERIKLTVPERAFNAVLAWRDDLNEKTQTVHCENIISVSYAIRTALLIGLTTMKERDSQLEKTQAGPARLSFTIPAWFLAELDQFAKSHNVNRADVMRTALLIALC